MQLIAEGKRIAYHSLITNYVNACMHEMKCNWVCTYVLFNVFKLVLLYIFLAKNACVLMYVVTV